MARGHGRVLSSIWEDTDFLALNEAEQRLYLFLISQPNLNHAGLLPLTLRRWARKAAGLTVAELEKRLQALADAHFIVVDDDTEEVFVSGFFHHAGTGAQPRVVVAALDALARSASPALRAVASLELSEAVATTPTPVARGVRAEVLRRDGWRCRSCGWSPGEPVPITANGRPLYRGLEIDHIHPKSLGGPDSIGNFQVLCSSCNASKGARV